MLNNDENRFTWDQAERVRGQKVLNAGHQKIQSIHDFRSVCLDIHNGCAYSAVPLAA